MHPCFVIVSCCRCCSEDEKREISRDGIYRGVSGKSTHGLGSHTLLQTLAVTQMWREEAITRERVLIDQDGVHAHTQTLAFLSLTLTSAARGCGSSKNRLSAPRACWWERGRNGKR